MKKIVLTGLLLSVFVGLSGLGKQHVFASSSGTVYNSNTWKGFKGLAEKRVAELMERVADLDVTCSYIKKIGEDIKDENEKNKILKVSNLFKDYAVQYKEEVVKTIKDWERLRAEADSKKTAKAIRVAEESLTKHLDEIRLLNKMDNGMGKIIREALRVLIDQMERDCYDFMINDLIDLQGKISARVTNIDCYKSEMYSLLNKVDSLYKKVSCRHEFLEEICKNGIEHIQPVLDEIYNSDYTLNKFYDIQKKELWALEDEWKELSARIRTCIQHEMLVNVVKSSDMSSNVDLVF